MEPAAPAVTVINGPDAVTVMAPEAGAAVRAMVTVEVLAAPSSAVTTVPVPSISATPSALVIVPTRVSGTMTVAAPLPVTEPAGGQVHLEGLGPENRNLAGVVQQAGLGLRGGGQQGGAAEGEGRDAGHGGGADLLRVRGCHVSFPPKKLDSPTCGPLGHTGSEMSR